MPKPEQEPSPLNSQSSLDEIEEDSGRKKAIRIIIHILVVLLALGIIFALRHVLMKHFFPSRGAGQSIGKLGYLYNKVVRRAAREPDFKKAALDLDLYENDAVRTFEDSHAEVIFAHGGEIRLDENTLIILRGFEQGAFGKPGQYNLFLEKGSIMLNLQGGEEVAHFVQTADQQLLLKGQEWGGKGRVGIQLQNDGNTRITAYSGNGSIEINGETLRLNQNEFILSGRGKKSTAKLLPPSKILLKQAENPIIFTHKTGQEVTLKWEPVSGAKLYTVEISKQPKFESTLVIADTPNDYYTYRLPGSGKYYWRMLAKTDAGQSEIKGRFRVVFEDAKALDDLVIDAQKNIVSDDTEKTTIIFQSDYPLVTFSWKAKRGAAKYRVEVYKDPDFQDQVFAEETSKTTVSTKPGLFHDSRYFWQVIALNAQGDPLEISDVFLLELVFDNAMPFLSIIEPQEGAKVAPGQVSVSGILPRNARVFVEGEELTVDSRGKFAGSVEVAPGTEQIIFKAVGGKGRIEYHPRTLNLNASP